MYVSWDAEGFGVYLERPKLLYSIWHGDTLLDQEDTETFGFEDLPGFPVPAVPTLWEVSVDGVKVVERVE